jgi:hypothetical protein
MSRRHEIECILLERHRAVYVEIPKVACTSIKTAIASLADCDGNPHEVRWPIPTVEPGGSGPPFPGLFTFAFVRDPWDRLVSCTPIAHTTFYTATTAAIVADRYARDVELFGYAFDAG